MWQELLGHSEVSTTYEMSMLTPQEMLNENQLGFLIKW